MMAYFTLHGFAFAAVVCSGLGLEPVFVGPLANITVPEGREATFTCTINHLGEHKVAWIRSDTQAILSIDELALSHVERLSVVRNDYTTWTLRLKNVTRADSGYYMCQVNTVPVRHQVGVLEVVVPPDIVTSETSSHVVIDEGHSARIRCEAKGHPQPTITWRREDGQDIIIRRRHRVRVQTFTGMTLHLTKVSRADMGVYLCIANNKIPPLVSRRIMVTVHFAPTVQVTTGLVAVPLGSSTTLSCRVEASPKPICYWTRPNGEVTLIILTGEIILTGARHRVHAERTSTYGHRMLLRISDVRPDDLRPYTCVAKNALGEAEDTAQLHGAPREIRVPVQRLAAPTSGPTDDPPLNRDGRDFRRRQRQRHQQTTAGQQARPQHAASQAATALAAPLLLLAAVAAPAP